MAKKVKRVHHTDRHPKLSLKLGNETVLRSQRNVSETDRFARLVLGVGFIASAYLWFTDTTQLFLFVLAGLAFFTALSGFSPVYKLLGISTYRRR